jgi:hypothetical protein
MPCLLLTTDINLDAPRVVQYEHRCAAAACCEPTRLGWIVAEADDLLRYPDFRPELAYGILLTNVALAGIYNQFADAPVARFKHREAGAKRLVKLLSATYGDGTGVTKVNEHDDEARAADDEHHEPAHDEPAEPSSGYEPEFELVLTIGARVTIVEDEFRGYPLEHGTIETGPDENGIITVRVDPAYRGAGDDGERLCEARDLAIDPEGHVRETPATAAELIKAEAAAARAVVREGMRQAKADAAGAEKLAKKAGREEKRQAKTDAAQAKRDARAERRQAKADVKAAKSAEYATKTAEAQVKRAAKEVEAQAKRDARGVKRQAKTDAAQAKRDAREERRQADVANETKAAAKKTKRVTKTAKTAKPKGNGGKPPVLGEFRPVVNGSSLSEIIHRVATGTATYASIAADRVDRPKSSGNQLTANDVRHRMRYGLCRDHGVDHTLDEHGVIHLVLPHGKSLEDLIAAPKSAEATA